MKKAVVYVRVSSREQEKEGFSIAAQIKLLEEHAQKLGLSIADIYTDAETAKKSGRHQFKAMVDRVIKDKTIGFILVEKTDRLTRNFQDYVLVDELIQKRDVEVHMVKEGEILSQRAKSHTKLIHGIKVVLAKNFIDNLAEETSKGMVEKAAQGYWPTTAPYGYRNNKQSRLVEIDVYKSRYIQRAFELYATGTHSIKTLIEQLHEEGFVFRPSTPKPSTSNMHHILTNLFYTGHFIFKGMEYVGHHPPLVMGEQFQQVQRFLKQGNKPRYSRRTVAFSNLMTCGHCGCSVTGDIKAKGRYIYYRCTHYRQKCPDKYIREEQLQAQFEAIIRSFAIDECQYQWMVAGLKQINASKDKEIEERSQAILQEIQRLNARLSQLYEDKLDGIIDVAFYRLKAQESNERLQVLEEQRARLMKANEQQMALGLQALEFAKDAYSQFSQMPSVEQAQLLRVVLSKCELKGGKLSPTYNKPFDVLAEGGKSKKWYPQGNSNPRYRRERAVS